MNDEGAKLRFVVVLEGRDCVTGSSVDVKKKIGWGVVRGIKPLSPGVPWITLELVVVVKGGCSVVVV